MSYFVGWSTEHDADSYKVPTIEQGKKECIDILKMWAFEIGGEWFGTRMPTPEEIEEWDDMVQNSEVFVFERKGKEEGTVVWEPSVDDVVDIWFTEWECIADVYEEMLKAASGETA